MLREGGDPLADDDVAFRSPAKTSMPGTRPGTAIPSNGSPYFPSHFGGRFSENAFGPSI